MSQKSRGPAQRRLYPFSTGFSLVEVMVTVVIITIIAAIALPNLNRSMQDRRTRLAAEEVARVYRDARLRAIGRGSAVVVRYNATNKSFDVREAVAGNVASAPAACAMLPSTNCQLADWTQGPTTLRGSQPVETVTLDEATEKTGVKVSVVVPSLGTSAQTEFSVCFTPLGRTFYSTTWGAPPNFSLLLSQVPIVSVYRTEPGKTDRIGLERRVVILPNGQARLQTAGT